MRNFLTDIIQADLEAGENSGKVVTRFPPEPNGFLHIGHAKSILLNFGLATQFGGLANLRFDDTNPTTEDTLYVASIQEDARWLGADWGNRLFFASDYFPKMYACAERLIQEGKAFVDSQTVEQIREQRGTFDKPGTESPFRNRSPLESLDLFRRMRAGEMADGACVLRAKIDMAAPNVLMRDPLLYRIRHAHHHRTQDAWCIYPMYDYAHPLEDAFEGVTHSICTLEFESNRELYNWVLDNLGPWNPRPHQYEFARLALGYTLMSKRKLLQLVTEKRVSGWDDPRMPTLAGMRRRGVTPEALKDFAERIGVAKNNSVVDIGKLDYAIRADLEPKTPRAMAVLNPLRVVLTNWPKGHVEYISLPWLPMDAGGASRTLPFGAEVLIERDDFSQEPPKGWKRLAPLWETRLMGAYVIKCERVIKSARGEVEALECTYDAASKGGNPADGRKVPGALHWVHAPLSTPLSVRLYDRLFVTEQPDAEGNFLDALNPHSLSEPKNARGEPALRDAKPGERYQFLRQGYFFTDPKDSRPGAPVYNRVITLKDTWSLTKPQVVEPTVAASGTTPGAAHHSKKTRAEHRAALRREIPELARKFERYQNALGLTEQEADSLTSSLEHASYFEQALKGSQDAKLTSKWLLNELLGLTDGNWAGSPLSATDFGKFLSLVAKDRVTSSAAKALLGELARVGGDPEALGDKLGVMKRQDEQGLRSALDRVMAAHDKEVTRYRAGEKKLFGVLVGALMRETQGRTDAAEVRKALQDRLG